MFQTEDSTKKNKHGSNKSILTFLSNNCLGMEESQKWDLSGQSGWSSITRMLRYRWTLYSVCPIPVATAQK